MKILFISDLFWPHVGGVEVWAAQLLPEMAARGHEVRVVTSGDTGPYPAADRLGDVRIDRFPMRRAFAGGALEGMVETRRAVATLKREFQPDVVHVGGVGFSTAFHQATRDVHPAPVLVTLVQEILASQRDGGETMLARTIESAGWVSSVSARVLEDARGLFPGIRGRSSVDYWGLDPQPAPRPFPPPPPRLLCLGRMVPAKGFDLMVPALAELRGHTPGLRLDLVGDGPERPGLEQAMAAAGLAEAARWEGWVPPHQVVSRMGDATVVVLPSRREGLPVVAIQAAWAGRPIVASDVGGMGEVVEDGRNGRLVPPEDPGALAAAIGDILADRSRIGAMGGESRAIAEERFSALAMYDAFERHYRNLTGEAAP